MAMGITNAIARVQCASCAQGHSDGCDSSIICICGYITTICVYTVKYRRTGSDRATKIEAVMTFGEALEFETWEVTEFKLTRFCQRRQRLHVLRANALQLTVAECLRKHGTLRKYVRRRSMEPRYKLEEAWKV